MKRLPLIISLVALVVLNVAAHWLTVRWDMTEDKRYSLNAHTITMVRALDEPLYVQCLLEGELNAGFKRLRHAVDDIIDEIDQYASVSPLAVSEEDKQSLGLQPTIIHEREKNGQTAQTALYPYVVLQYKGRKAVLPLLYNNRSLRGEENINNSIAGLEYAFAEAIHGLAADTVESIAFLEGHGELPEAYVADITAQLSRYFRVDRGALEDDPTVLDAYKVVIIADPQQPFTEVDKYILNHYVMQGGRVLWLINGVRFSTDVLTQQGFTPAIALDLNISDMLFRYGVRIDPALVQDVQCLPIPVDVSGTPEQPNYQPMPWYYAPLLLTSQASPITRNCMQVSATFASPVEAVGGEDGIAKNILLATSTASRLIGTPAQVDLSDLHPDMETFRYQFIPVAMSLEGVFPSLYAHRLPPQQIQDAQSTSTMPESKTSVPTKQIIIGCGNVIRNEIQKGQPLPVGYDRYSGMLFGNRDVLVNSVLWLADDQGVIDLRGKEITLRLLNDKKARSLWTTIQVTTICIPLLILALIGLVVYLIRKQMYMKKISVIVLLMACWVSIQAQDNKQLLNYPLDTINGKVFYLYPVDKGIGLWRISVNFGVSQDEILQYNPQVVKTGMRYGETVLRIPVNEQVLASLQPAPAEPQQPVVAPEEKKPLQEEQVVESKQDTMSIAGDTVIFADTIQQPLQDSLSLTVKDTTKGKSIALLLPLRAQDVERDATAERFFEFYAGILLALQDVQSPDYPYSIYVYDTGRSVTAVRNLIDEGKLTAVDAIIGPAYPAQILPVSDFAKTDSIPVYIPFSDRVVGIETNAMLWQFNPSDELRAEAIADYLVEQGDSTINIVLPDAQEEDIPRSVLAIRKAIAQRHLPITSVTVQDILNDSLSKALSVDKKNYLLFNTERYSNLSVLMPMIMRAVQGQNVTLIGQYSWQHEPIKIPQIYPSVFAVAQDSAYNDSALVAYNQRYEALLGQEHAGELPRYDLLGYDLMRELDAEWKEQEYRGIQSDMDYQRLDSVGGYINKAIRIVYKQ